MEGEGEPWIYLRDEEERREGQVSIWKEEKRKSSVAENNDGEDGEAEKKRLSSGLKLTYQVFSCLVAQLDIL